MEEHSSVSAPEPEATSAQPQKKVYKLRLFISILCGLFIPVTLIPFLSALLVYNSTELAPSFIDWITFTASILSPLVFLVACIGGIWCARGIESARKKTIGRTLLVMPLICLALIALIYV